MSDLRVDLDLGTGLNDGTTWPNAYQGAQGFETAMAAAVAGDRVFVKDASSGNSGSSIILNASLGISGATNPVQVIGVRSDASDAVLKTDVILGLREGDSTRAYLQTGAEAPPNVLDTSQEILWNGAVYFYGLIFTPGGNSSLLATNNIVNNVTMEECHFNMAGGQLTLGQTDGYQRLATFRNCLFEMAARIFRFAQGNYDFYNCEFTGTLSGFLQGSGRFVGVVRFYNCDFSACNATLVDISVFFNGRVEFYNCKYPASHILTTGTATGFFTVNNWGSEDNTGFMSLNSEQARELHTHLGTLAIETTVVRDGGASDLANGAYAWAIDLNNVTDNFVGMPTPWMHRWVKGDGTAKTASIFIANSDAEAAGNLLEDDQIHMETRFPSESGISQFDYLPDEGAPGDGGGRTQLLGTPVDIATDSSVWGTGGNNKQKLSQPIAPDYQGYVSSRLIYSKSASPPTLFVDPGLDIV